MSAKTRKPKPVGAVLPDKAQRAATTNVTGSRAQERIAIEYRPVKSLVDYEKNARTHSEAQIQDIANSIRRFGFVNPVLIGDDGMIVAGHGRVMAARKIGMNDVPVIVLDNLNEAQRRALVLADNKIALNSGWDSDLLASELREIGDFDGLGFSAQDLVDLFDEDGESSDLDVADAEGETGGDDVSSSATDSDRREIKVPLLIELSRSEFDRWKKLRAGRSDREMFLALMGEGA